MLERKRRCTVTVNNFQGQTTKSTGVKYAANRVKFPGTVWFEIVCAEINVNDVHKFIDKRNKHCCLLSLMRNVSR